MVYTYKMWDEDGHQISEGLYETGARPTTDTGPDVVPIELKGRMFAQDHHALPAVGPDVAGKGVGAA